MKMGIETLTEMEFIKSIDDCSCGKKDKSLSENIDGHIVCGYKPLEFGFKKNQFCKHINAILDLREKGTYYSCGKDMAYAEKGKA